MALYVRFSWYSSFDIRKVYFAVSVECELIKFFPVIIDFSVTDSLDLGST